MTERAHAYFFLVLNFAGTTLFLRVALFATAMSIAIACARPEETSAQDRTRKAEHAWVASTKGQVYYSLKCDAWKNLAVANLRYYKSSSDAERAGFVASRAPGCAPPNAATRITARTGGSATCNVSRVPDGDSFECTSGDRVRLLLVDAPELAQKTVGDSARRALAAIIPVGTTVRLDFDVDVRDTYDRLLAYVFRGTTFVNRELGRRGYAVVIVVPPNVKHVASIRAAVDSAQRERRGFWRTGAFSCKPVDFRAGRCGGEG